MKNLLLKQSKWKNTYSQYSLSVLMFDSNSYDTLKLSDAWNKNKKFPSDSYGLVNLKMANGR